MRLNRKAKKAPRSGGPGVSTSESPAQSYEDIIVDQRQRLLMAEATLGQLQTTLEAERGKSGELLTQIAQNHAEANAWTERFAEAIRSLHDTEILGLRESKRIMGAEIEALIKERDQYREALRKVKTLKDQFG